MNILYIAHESRLGGANLSLLGMIDELRETNNIYVAVPIAKGFLVDELKKRKIPVYHRHYFWWMLAPAGTGAGTLCKKILYRFLLCNNYLCAASLIGVVRKRQIDIIHTNSGVVNTGGILAAMTKVPHVWHLREFGQEDFNFFPVWRYERICDFIDKNSAKVIAISQAIADKFRERLANNCPEVVYNGVDEANTFCKSESKDMHGTIEFLISGRISPEKGQEEAILAVAKLLDRGYRNLHLSIAGPGDSSKLQALIREKDLERYVSLLGTVQDMPGLRRETDVEMVCSLCEGFGRVTAEAMMSSNPVIGSNTGGTPELIEDGVTGYLYQRGNVEELADKMELFLQHPEQIRSLGNNAYTVSNRKFTRKKNAEEIETIYRKMLEDRL